MNIYVGRLPRNVNESSLRGLFEQYGEVTTIKVIKDKFTGAPKGFAFIEMPAAEQASEAISALNGAEFEGQRLEVSEARPRQDRPAGGSRDGGSRGGFGGNSRPPRFNNNRY